MLSSITAGILWRNFDSEAPFIFGGIPGITSAVYCGNYEKARAKARAIKKRARLIPAGRELL
ncbi:MAG TPA: hypothetical protein VHO66_03760 [Ruminiclostridium sp.]|nr:hypothetical protein [Ruminiclostridium sp.]